MLITVTWPLWLPQSQFPQVPFWSLAGSLPTFVEAGLLVVLLASLVGMWRVRYATFQRISCGLVVIATLGLVLIDQHRLQPWVWQFLILSLVCLVSDSVNARTAWRWLVIGIYAWSAWSKLERGFYIQHGPFLLEGFIKAIGMTHWTRFWPDSTRSLLAALFPLIELLIAVGLCRTRTRRLAVITAAVMHVGLIMALGPWGYAHQPGVLVWNLSFLVQNWVLFAAPQPHDDSRLTAADQTLAVDPWSNRLGKIIVTAVLIWPAFEAFGYCDHWLAWAVYAAKPERVTVFISENDLDKLPDSMTRYWGSDLVFDGWRTIRIDRWSLDTLRVPLYPQDRFQVGVALGLVQRFQLSTIRVVIDGPSHWRTGERPIREYVGIKQIEQLADSYYLGARPRVAR